jgi:CO/xanthine dehydrogenase Mo-binding subunit
MTFVGQEPRSDFSDKVTGSAEFVSDVALPGMLHGKILRSTIPHGLIRDIDLTGALAMPGVVAVLTGQDIAGLNTHWGLFLKDRPVIAIDRVRYVGEPVAMVAAVDERTAEDAIDAIMVDYEPLPFVTDAEEAMADDAPLLHDNMETLKDFYFKGEAKPVADTNVFQNYNYAHGDVDAAFEAADRCFEDRFTFPMIFHYAMEPHCVTSADGRSEGDLARLQYALGESASYFALRGWWFRRQGVGEDRSTCRSDGVEGAPPGSRLSRHFRVDANGTPPQCGDLHQDRRAQ